ncbi:polysialyltransferase family glycosyltransferase [Amycolatopsis sp. NPDC049868]|uniref:polysialyltransferase family glycosyltransferase n=1 Tax=Amycolatopsis sp. NPDC049868 TaxID=3363934 RepID=UPI0037B93D4C
MTIRRVFCASTGFHVLVHQAIVLACGDQDVENHLVIYHPLSRPDNPNHIRGFSFIDAMLLQGVWTSVIPAGDLAAPYDVANVLSSASAFSVAAEAQRELDRRLSSVGKPTEVFITNPTCGAIDRHLWTWARACDAQTHFVEDGISAYLPATLKAEIDSPYTRDRAAQSLARYRGLEPDLDLLALQPAVYPALRFDQSHVLLPDKVPSSLHNGQVSELPRSMASVVLHRALTQLPASSVGQRSDRSRWTAVYISRPDHEDGLVDEEPEIDTAVEAIRAMVRMGHRVVVKPHPRDTKAKIQRIVDISKADVVEDGDHVPIELLLARHRPQLACGTWSGSVLYSALLAGISTSSVITHLVQRANHQASTLLARIEQQFLRIMDGVPNYRQWEQLQ